MDSSTVWQQCLLGVAKHDSEDRIPRHLGELKFEVSIRLVLVTEI